ncbi:MAG: exodeoxyribonuclease VII large subunit [Burkholderiales bacterium]
MIRNSNNGRPGSDADTAPERDDLPGRQVVLPVSLLVSSARLLIERHLGLTWVSGEISNFTRAASGHCYFQLKDAQAQVRCVLFRQRAQLVDFALRDGLGVEVRATPSIYEPRGEFQLNVDSVRLAGVGALYEKFARLKAKLEAAGWFAAERKRPLPAHPRAVGIVSSPRAAALRDILATLARRWPSMRVVLYPTAVQGAGAAAEIAAAIAVANARAEVDVLIVARGGGSIEDLWAFNEEAVAQAVFASALPVISGVGHETDFTICDFVADARAPTPTAAAALAVPDRAALAQRIASLVRHVERAMSHALDLRAQRLDHATRRLVHPAARVALQRERVAELVRRFGRAWRTADATRRTHVGAAHRQLLRDLREPPPGAARLRQLRDALRRLGRERVARAALRVDALAQNVGHLNPQAVLERGYAIVAARDGAIVVDASQVDAGDDVALTFARGGADARVTRRKLPD